MTDVREVFLTSEVAKDLDYDTAYIIRVAKTLDLSEADFRPSGKRNYLFSKNAVEILRKKFAENQNK
ncbi:MAG: hypothetical protein ACRCWD_07080 [Culicoidibacterales bacterium]